MFAILALAAAMAPSQTLSRIQVGDPAPSFALPASKGNSVSLAAFKGKKAVVLAFFPKAFTGGCTRNLKISEVFEGQAAWTRPAPLAPARA